MDKRKHYCCYSTALIQWYHSFSTGMAGGGPFLSRANTSVDTTEILRAWRNGDTDAAERVLPLVYQELHRMAHRLLNNEHHVTMLQTTGLVHEAYLRIAGGMPQDWEGRSHLMAVFARTMRNVLVDYARQRAAAKRGADPAPVPFHEELMVVDGPGAGVLEVDEALRRLEQADPARARVVELHYFGGLTLAECATALDCSQRTVQRHLAAAEAWLYTQLRPSR